MPSQKPETLVLFEKKGHVGIITLNRPRAMNAISEAVAMRMEAIIDDFEKDDDMWIAILKSSNPKVAHF